MIKDAKLSRQAEALQQTNQDWAVIIAAIAAGDQMAMNQFYDGTSRLVFGLVLRILGDRSLAEEVLLDVYTQVWRQAHRYDTSRGAPLGWLTTIARSRAIDRLRAERHARQQDELHEETTQEPNTAANPENLTALAELRTHVQAALDLLPPEQREVIELSYYSGYTQSEIAAHLNQPLGTVKTRTRLGMIKLREVLKPLMGKSYEG